MNRLSLCVISLALSQFALSAQSSFEESDQAKNYSEASTYSVSAYKLSDARDHKLSIKANVAIAEISLGQERGNGELKIGNLSAGIYTLKVTSPNYQSLDANIYIEANKKYDVRVELKNSKGGILLLPAEGQDLDSEALSVQIGDTTYAVASEIVERAGPQKIVVKKFGYKDLTIVSNLSPDTKKTITFKLEKLPFTVKLQRIERAKFNPLAKAGYNYARIFLEANGPGEFYFNVTAPTGFGVFSQAVSVSARVSSIDFFGWGEESDPLPPGRYGLSVSYEGIETKIGILVIDTGLDYPARNQSLGLRGGAGVPDSSKLNEGDFSIELGLNYIDFGSFAPNLGLALGLGPGELGFSAKYLTGSTPSDSNGLPIKVGDQVSNLDLHLAYKWILLGSTESQIVSVALALSSGTSSELDLIGQVKLSPLYFVLNPAIDLSYISKLDSEFHGRSALGFDLGGLGWALGCDYEKSLVHSTEAFLFKTSLVVGLSPTTLSLGLEGSYSPTNTQWSIGLRIINLQSLF